MNEGFATVDRGQITGATKTLGEYVSDVFAVNAALAAQVERREGSDRALVEDLRFRQAAVSGVNLDEELARLQLYQQAYNISARLISITNQLFEELMNIGR